MKATTQLDKDAAPSCVKYCVIMTLYSGDDPEYFKQSFMSILQQTLLPAEIVIAFDGAVSNGLQAAYRAMRRLSTVPVRSVRLSENKGHGAACNAAVKASSCELIGKLDADDIAFPDRFERQVSMFLQDDDLAVCSGHLAEFSGDTSVITSERRVPSRQSEIRAFMRRRSPFNHPAVMYKRSAVLAVGGYPEIRRAEDYCLWVKLLAGGYKGANIDAPLVYFRASGDSYGRKKSWGNIVDSMRARWFGYKRGMSSLWDVFVVFVAHVILFILPRRTIAGFYKLVLRRDA
ncbi:MAG: glycosyltransferase [Candidatus Saccharibacteria bacterium]|nr:glycosyltransferase [Candidatus Saccharibacteria bacterium]